MTQPTWRSKIMGSWKKGRFDPGNKVYDGTGWPDSLFEHGIQPNLVGDKFLNITHK